MFLGDDDYYYRVDRIFLWLSYVAHSDVNHLPLVANGFTQYNYARDRDPNCMEIVTYGWYGTMMMNRAALNLYSKIPYGLKRTCSVFHFPL